VYCAYDIQGRFEAVRKSYIITINVPLFKKLQDIRFPDDAVQYLAFGEKYWDVMYSLLPSTSSQPSSTGT
jgi:hypothetical protein